MCSSEALREFITDTLTAAATQIFTVFQQTIDQYKEEIDRQRRLLQTHTHDNTCQLKTSFSLKQVEPLLPQERETLLFKQEPADDENLQPPPASEDSAFTIILHRIDLPQQHTSQDEKEPAQVQKDQEEQEPLLLNQEPDSVLGADTKSEADSQQIISNNYSLAEYIKQEHPTNDTKSSSSQVDHLRSSSSEQASPFTFNDEQHFSQQSFRREGPSVGQPSKDHTQEHHEPASVKLTEQQCNTPFSCDICGKYFNQSSSLEQHTKYHKLKKNHSCQTCGKSFITATSLKEHMRTHTGEKPYSCEICGKCFICKNNLKCHRRIHTGEKPYICEICGRGFVKNDNLKSHLKTHVTWMSESGLSPIQVRDHIKPHSCETCGKCFTRKSDLKRHIYSHTGEKPHSCQLCGKRFTRKQTLKYHIRSHMGEVGTGGPSLWDVEQVP